MKHRSTRLTTGAALLALGLSATAFAEGPRPQGNAGARKPAEAPASAQRADRPAPGARTPAGWTSIELENTMTTSQQVRGAPAGGPAAPAGGAVAPK